MVEIIATYSYAEMDVEVSREVHDDGMTEWIFEKVGNNYEKKLLKQYEESTAEETVPTYEQVYEEIVLENLGE
jgi:hypothetical protein